MFTAIKQPVGPETEEDFLNEWITCVREKTCRLSVCLVKRLDCGLRKCLRLMFVRILRASVLTFFCYVPLLALFWNGWRAAVKFQAWRQRKWPVTSEKHNKAFTVQNMSSNEVVLDVQLAALCHFLVMFSFRSAEAPGRLYPRLKAFSSEAWCHFLCCPFLLG